MTTEQQALAIVLAIRDACDREGGQGEPMLRVGFAPDWGGNSLTILYADGSHTHVGDTDDTDDQLVEQLHALLCEGRGLSRAGGAR